MRKDETGALFIIVMWAILTVFLLIGNIVTSLEVTSYKQSYELCMKVRGDD